MSTATATKVTDIVKSARKIAEESNRPMSPDQIKGKFQLEFPFTVKRVVGAPCKGSCDYHKNSVIVGAHITFIGLDEEGDYLEDCQDGCHSEHAVFHNSERFVLV